MRSNYKPLGKYIRIVDERNRDLEDLPLMGLSVSKVFFPSIANLVGTNMATYKIVYKKQFTYIADTSRRGDKIAIAINNSFDKMLVSQAYTPFEVKNANELDPEYLMMWFRRPEFDRYARFKSHGSAREIFDWEEMCNTLLPVPSITKQREIVREYNTIQNRIKLNEQLNQKLEATAQALYKHWFVDFEFPDENGRPYISSGGRMVYNEELDKEIPEGWEVNGLGRIAVISAGGDKPKAFSFTKTDDCKIPVFSNSSNNEGLFGFTNKAKVLAESITISARGAIIGYTKLRLNPFVPIVRLIVVTPKSKYQLNYLFNCIQTLEFDSAASAQGQLTVPEISSFQILMPGTEVLKRFQKINSEIIEEINIKKSENRQLIKLQMLLLSKMATVEKELELTTLN